MGHSQQKVRQITEGDVSIVGSTAVSYQHLCTLDIKNTSILILTGRGESTESASMSDGVLGIWSGMVACMHTITCSCGFLLFLQGGRQHKERETK